MEEPIAGPDETGERKSRRSRATCSPCRSQEGNGEEAQKERCPHYPGLGERSQLDTRGVARRLVRPPLPEVADEIVVRTDTRDGMREKLVPSDPPYVVAARTETGR